MTAVTATPNKFEKFKAEKDGLAVKSQIEEFARIGWEAMDETDRDHRLKWLGVFFRPVTPGKFMMRLRMPHGITDSAQFRVLGETIQRYGDEGTADITTRQSIQLRGIRIEDLPEIFRQMGNVGMSSVQSGMDNVRNITGSPVAGLDAGELYDTRGLVQQLQDIITDRGQGNPEFTNLPRKFNIAIAGCRDNSVHAEINDLAFVPAIRDDVFGFNIVVGGFFSGTRCEAAIPLNAWVPPEDVVDFSVALLKVFRDGGLRGVRTKTRLMWLIDEWGIDKFRSETEKVFGKPLAAAAEKDEFSWEKRDFLGIYPQQQEGLHYAGINVPVGKMYAEDFFEIARLAEVYGTGEIRLTIEQNVIIPHIPTAKLDAFQTEPLLERFQLDPGGLTRRAVSCTGAQFCNFALIDTKSRALETIAGLEAELNFPNPIRMHWTGCPNSCGQPQVAEIGLMGAKVKKDGKMAEGVSLFMGGKVGKDAHLGTCVQKNIACDDLHEVLRNILIEQFGALPK
jgi:ferredoxin-nitrite reductase